MDPMSESTFLDLCNGDFVAGLLDSNWSPQTPGGVGDNGAFLIMRGAASFVSEEATLL
jgi:hypothetical protein